MFNFLETWKFEWYLFDTWKYKHIDIKRLDLESYDYFKLVWTLKRNWEIDTWNIIDNSLTYIQLQNSKIILELFKNSKK